VVTSQDPDFHGLNRPDGPQAALVQNCLDWTAGSCNLPPEIICHGPAVLWPPLHDLVDVSSTFSVSDPNGDAITVTVRMFCEEPELPDAGDGTGGHAADFKTQLASGDSGVFVRVERRGAENGRCYIALITAQDEFGATTTAVCAVAAVPRDLSDPEAVSGVLVEAHAAAADLWGVLDLLSPVTGAPVPPPADYLLEHGVVAPCGPKQ
jgi:hypothetical protein